MNTDLGSDERHDGLGRAFAASAQQWSESPAPVQNILRLSRRRRVRRRAVTATVASGVLAVAGVSAATVVGHAPPAISSSAGSAARIVVQPGQNIHLAANADLTLVRDGFCVSGSGWELLGETPPFCKTLRDTTVDGLHVMPGYGTRDTDALADLYVGNDALARIVVNDQGRITDGSVYTLPGNPGWQVFTTRAPRIAAPVPDITTTGYDSAGNVLFRAKNMGDSADALR